jgi:3-demethoxyubiquinol 3-hydroxylase
MIDALIIEFDKALRTVLAPAPTLRRMPGESLPEAELDSAERRHAAALMRINHVGEVCAQALYQGQALGGRNPAIREALVQAANEETEHLNWTERRIAELGGRKSLLNPLWYAGSLAIGIAAARCGDGWNLGFLAETEKQVEAHLDRHLAGLPPADLRSQAVLAQMRSDEIRHADTAVQLGARELPRAVKLAMAAMSKVMTSTAYWV